MAKNQEASLKENPMRKVEIEKIILTCRGIEGELDKGVKLLEMITEKKIARKKTEKRIPGFSIRPKMNVGCMVTLRGKDLKKILARLLSGVENTLNESQVVDNHFSFGIKEYIEISGIKYDREIGMIGLGVTVDFARKGKRVARKKIKRGKLPVRQAVTKEEIIKYMEENFGTEFE